MTQEMEEIFEKLENNRRDEAVALIKEQLSKRDQDFIEDFIQSLSIITEMDVDVVKEIMPKLLAILDLDDDIIRYSMLAALKDYAPKYKELIFPYVNDYLKYGSPKKREGILILLKYIAEKSPESLEPFYDNIIALLADIHDYVRKNTIELLKILGKVDKEVIEAKILGFLREYAQKSEKYKEQNKELIEEAEKIKSHKEKEQRTAADNILLKVADIALAKGSKSTVGEDILKEAANSVLREIVSVSDLEPGELEKLELKARSKALEKELEDEEEEIRLKRLQLLKEEKELEQRKLEQELEKIEKEKELLDKQKELERVKRELMLKKLEQEKEEIMEEERKILEKRLQRLREKEAEQSNDDYDEIQL